MCKKNITLQPPNQSCNIFLLYTIPYVVMIVYRIAFVILYPTRYPIQPSKMLPKAAILSELREQQLSSAID